MPYLENNGFEQTEISLELSFKERDPIDSQFMKQVKESVNYWKQNNYLDGCNNYIGW